MSMSTLKPYSFWPVDPPRSGYGEEIRAWAVGRWGPAMFVLTDDEALVALVVDALNAQDDKEN